MVKKEHIIRWPICTAIFPVFASVFYSGVYLGVNTALIVGAVFFCVFVCKTIFINKQKCILYASILYGIALILAFCSLTRLLWARVPVQTLLPQEKILSISGKILTSPVPTSRGDYSLLFKTSAAQSISVSSSAEGTLSLIVPSQLVEAYYPGKLYSQTSSYVKNTSTQAQGMPPLIEQGLICTFYGRMSQEFPLFYVSAVSPREHTSWSTSLNKIRSDFRLQLKRLLYTWNDAGGLLLALLSGSREYLHLELADNFRVAGLSHVLALSGMHLSLFGGLSAVLGKCIGGKRLTILFSLMCMTLFVWFAGVSPSLLRALLCATLISLCAISGLNPKMLDILCAAFIFQTIAVPSHTIQLSFLLSYGALFGIVLLGNALTALLPIRKTITSPFTASLSAQVFTAPFTIAFFSLVTPIGILSSVVVSPLALWFLTCGIICIPIVLVFPSLLQPIGFIIQLFYSAIEYIVSLFAKFPSISF